MRLVLPGKGRRNAYIGFMFPVTITLTKSISIEKVEAADILNGISDELKRLSVDDIVLDDRHVTFKNAFFNRKQGRWHLMAMVDSGTFDYNIYSKKLSYRYSTARSCLFCLGMSVLLGLFVQSFLVWLLGFLWLYGVNWIICLARQTGWFNKLFR
jgi:hypothetical protein